MSVAAVDRRCRWCLEPLAGASVRRQFCNADCRKRHHSRSRYAPADGYGAELRAARCCRCGNPVGEREIVQGRNSKVTCEDCQLPPEKVCPNCEVVHRGSFLACSDECSRALRRRHFERKDRRRRERIASSPESFTREEIIERDGWRCGICGGMTDREQEHPHPDAPVVDHIVPIAAGGEHVRSNVQCAHSRCNTLKGAAIPDDGA